MVPILLIVAVLAGISAALGVVDLVTLVGPGATVFQQISVRVDIGLSALVFVTALGFAGVLRRMDGSPASVAAGKAEIVETYRGTRITRRGDVYGAIIKGEALESHSPEALKVRIDEAKASG